MTGSAHQLHGGNLRLVHHHFQLAGFVDVVAWLKSATSRLQHISTGWLATLFGLLAAGDARQGQRCGQSDQQQTGDDQFVAATSWPDSARYVYDVLGFSREHRTATRFSWWFRFDEESQTREWVWVWDVRNLLHCTARWLTCCLLGTCCSPQVRIFDTLRILQEGESWTRAETD